MLGETAIEGDITVLSRFPSLDEYGIWIKFTPNAELLQAERKINLELARSIGERYKL